MDSYRAEIRGTILPKIDLTGEFCFIGVCLIGQLEYLGKLTEFLM